MKKSGPGQRSVPIRQDLLSFRNLSGGTSKANLQFAGPASHLNRDGIQAANDHSLAELFVNFIDPVLLKAFAHGRGSGRAPHKATAKVIECQFGW